MPDNGKMEITIDNLYKLPSKDVDHIINEIQNFQWGTKDQEEIQEIKKKIETS